MITIDQVLGMARLMIAAAPRTKLAEAVKAIKEILALIEKRMEELDASKNASGI